MSWELPQVSEFKNDLPMPVFQNMQALEAPQQAPPQSPMPGVVPIKDGPPPADGPVSDHQWDRVKQMVASPPVFVFSLAFVFL
jgi:hypothetical protein